MPRRPAGSSFPPELSPKNRSFFRDRMRAGNSVRTRGNVRMVNCFRTFAILPKGGFAGPTRILATGPSARPLVPAHRQNGPLPVRGRPKLRLNAEFDDSLMHNHDVVAKQLQERLIFHGRVGPA